MSDFIFVGIDPGLSGGIVALNDRQEVIYKNVMPVIKGKKTEYDIKGILNCLWFEHPSAVYVMLEKQHVRPVSGKRACFSTGRGYGICETAVIARDLSYEIINPTVWMKEIFKGLDIKDKKASVMFCKRKWPNEDWTATERSKKDHDGLTDAACLALYSYRINSWIRQ